ncbi:hypothetical protein HHK36_017754 [Tetracentron sinense]|uniref:Uncharacterized protein n=1 Tax=Tetracentron sinense TaxID=13715 RepID=A0A834Z2K9_TETSI|nr:hypothetical protein HHK36_017754 [Tetracentron sinense]
MAALSIDHFLHTKNSSIPKNRPTSKIHLSLSCQIREPIRGSSDRKKEKEKKKEDEKLFSKLYDGVEKVGKGLKDNLSPKQKGDWKDLVLMSLSFAVYVYISQKIVCAYCAWMSMPKQPW